MGRAEAANVEGQQAPPRTSPTLGKYQLLAVLGRGGMAEVFLALSRGAMGFDKLAVVKRLRPSMAEDEGFRAMFLDEARLAARLNHPNVVHTYEVGEHNGAYYLAMEFLEGQPLNKIAHEAQKRGTPLDATFAARIISDALLGLHHAHTLKDFDGRPLQIIHRDISPHNLFVTYEGTTKVVDFGIAKTSLSSTETEVGVLKGKVGYMSPEQARGLPLDPRSDVFAMGIVLWELLTQRKLMTGDSAASTIHRLLTAPVPPASSLRGDLAPSLDAIVERALQKDPDQRFPSALAMREAIEAYLTSTGRPVRNEAIGAEVAAMFAGIRAAIQRQVQEHVAGASADPSGDRRVQDDPDLRPSIPSDGGMLLTRDLPVLLEASGGSGSGVVSKPRGGGTGVAEGAAAGAALRVTGVAPAPATGLRASRVAGFVLLLLAVVATSAATQYLLGRSPAPAVATSPAEPAATAATAAPPSLPPPPVAAASAAAAAAPAASAAPAPASPPSVGAAAKGPRPHAPEAVGYLTFDTYPWTRVTEGGAPLGTTPLVRLALPAGSHTLSLDNGEQGIHQTYAVTIKAGELVTKRLGLK